LPQDCADDISSAGAQGHADANLVSSRGHDIRNHAVQAYGREHRREHCKKPERAAIKRSRNNPFWIILSKA
jgi:hypothetical protein